MRKVTAPRAPARACATDAPGLGYWASAHTLHRLRLHLVWIPKYLVWIPKYRRRVLDEPIAARLTELLHQACQVRGWGLHEDSFVVMDALRELGAEIWFNLGDRDLAWCIERSRMLAEGLSPAIALARLNASIGVGASVLPMSDDPVRTWVRTSDGWRSFQEFMIRDRAAGLVEGLEFRGAEQARPCKRALEAIARAEAIVIGPSNPLASIAPILAVPGIREALDAARAPVVAVSPIVGGEVLKGPTASFMAFAALDCSASGVADFYGELLDGIVADEGIEGQLPALQADTRMNDAESRASVARLTLDFAEALAG